MFHFKRSLGVKKQPNGCYLWCKLTFNLRGGSVDQDNTILADYCLDVKACTKRLLLIWICCVILFGIITIKSTLFDISLMLEVIYSQSWILYLNTTCIDNVNIISRLIQSRKFFKRTEHNFNGAIIQIQLREILMKSEGNIDCVYRQIKLRVILNFELSTYLLYEKSLKVMTRITIEDDLNSLKRIFIIKIQYDM
jgi:hypothetical protein